MILVGSVFWMCAVVTVTNPGDVIAKVNGVPVSRSEYQSWLFEVHGWRFLDDYLSLVLLRQEAMRLSIAVPDVSDLENAFEAEWRDQVVLRYRGNEEAFLRELREGGLDKQTYRQRRIGGLEQELLAERVVLATRAPTEQELRSLYSREFEGDVRTHLRLAFFDKLKKVQPGQRTTRPFLEQADAETMARAQAFLDAVRADPAAFEKRLTADTDPLFLERRDSFLYDLREHDGDLPRYRKDHLGGILEVPLKDAVSHAWLGPIAAPNGFYVVEIVERSPTNFDQVRSELETLFKTELPTAGEIHALKARLLEQASIEKSIEKTPR